MLDYITLAGYILGVIAATILFGVLFSLIVAGPVIVVVVLLKLLGAF